MNYKVLSTTDTNIWLSNFDKVIELANKLEKYMSERMQRMDDEYTAKFRSGWRKFVYDKDYWISYNGHAYPLGGMFKCKGVEPLSSAEKVLRSYVYDYKKSYKNDFKNTKERWAKYAKQPFEIQESDITFYQQLKHFHEYSLKVAKQLGIDYEAFNLDEDCQDSC